PPAPARGRAGTPRASTATARGCRSARTGASDPHGAFCTSLTPSLLVLAQELLDAVARAFQGGGPLGQQLSAAVGELVPPLRGTRRLGVPLGADQPLRLQPAQGAIEVPHV